MPNPNLAYWGQHLIETQGLRLRPNPLSLKSLMIVLSLCRKYQVEPEPISSLNLLTAPPAPSHPDAVVPYPCHHPSRTRTS